MQPRSEKLRKSKRKKCRVDLIDIGKEGRKERAVMEG